MLPAPRVSAQCSGFSTCKTCIKHKIYSSNSTYVGRVGKIPPRVRLRDEMKYVFHITLQFLAGSPGLGLRRLTGRRPGPGWSPSSSMMQRWGGLELASYVTSLFIIHYYHHYMIKTIIIHFLESNERIKYERYLGF